MAGRRPFPSAPEPTVSYAPDSVPSPEKRSRWLPATALTCGEAPSGAWGPVPSPLALTRVQRPLPANFISFQNVGPANGPRAWGISSPCTWAQPPGAGHVRGAVLAPGSLAGDRLALDADGATRQAHTAGAHGIRALRLARSGTARAHVSEKQLPFVGAGFQRLPGREGKGQKDGRFSHAFQCLPAFLTHLDSSKLLPEAERPGPPRWPRC